MTFTKMLLPICLLAICALSSEALKCWTCENAASPNECVRNGAWKQCRYLEKSCQTVVRVSEGYKTYISTGCKEADACGRNEEQNPRSAWTPTQCNGDTMNSVCRCCCGTNRCNKKNLLCKPQRGDAPAGNLRDETAKPTPTEPVTCKNVLRIPANGNKICLGEKELGAVCKFTCNSGFELVGSQTSKCVQKRPKAKVARWTNRVPVCREMPMCDEIHMPVNGIVECDNGKRLGSVCTFSCNGDYELKGTSKASCDRNGKLAKWSQTSPQCIATCDELQIPFHGMVECDNGKSLGSECTFFCNDDYELKGTPKVTCQSNGKLAKWSQETPQCIAPTPTCKDLGNFPHGEIVCSRQDNEVGTVCGFRCVDDGYELQSTTDSIECIVDATGEAKWSHRKPCCTSQCPPTAKKDVVIVMDSSSSISTKEWKIMKNFVANITGKFEVSEEGVQFAVYRFNKRIDENSQVLFGQFANDVEGLKQAVISMPKRGGGTFIGRALSHAKNHVLTTNNREDVKDLIWVLTDGRSDDKLEVVSKQLRDSGVEIMALGISRKEKSVDMKELINMTGHRDNVMEVKNGMESLTDNLSRKIVGKICQFSCPVE